MGARGATTLVCAVLVIALAAASEVAAAESAAADTARTVDSVRTDLARAAGRLQASSIAAAQAAEAFNAARWQHSLARDTAVLADRASQVVSEAVHRQRSAYASALASSYWLAPDLTALSAIVRSDGIENVVEGATTLTNAAVALESQYDDFRAAATAAYVIATRVAEARAAAEELKEQTRAARDGARAAERQTTSEVAVIADERDAP